MHVKNNKQSFPGTSACISGANTFPLFKCKHRMYSINAYWQDPMAARA